MITFITASSGRELGESVIFQPVLQPYPTCHSWIIMAHVSLGHLEHHWKAFNRQLIRTCQLLHFLNQQPSAPTQLLSTLQVEFTNIKDMYNSCKTTIISAIDLLNTNPSFDGQSQSNIHCRRSLLPFLGDGLRWLMGTATTKDVISIKIRLNQFIVTQSSQQECSTSGQCLLTFAILSTTSEQFLHIPWIILMHPHQEHYLCTSYPSWIYKRCYIYQIPYHLHCTYLSHQVMPCI